MKLLCGIVFEHVWGWHFEGFPDEGMIAESVRCERCGRSCLYWNPGDPLPLRASVDG